MDQTPQSQTPLFTIGTAARMLGISVHTLRMYERDGLIIPFKAESNHRLYSVADLERVACIRRAIAEEKMTIAGIRRLHAMIPCWELIPCTVEERRACPAFRSHDGGCWTAEEKGRVCSTRDCRLCTVYQQTANCDSIKDNIRRLSSAGQLDAAGVRVKVSVG